MNVTTPSALQVASLTPARQPVQKTASRVPVPNAEGEKATANAPATTAQGDKFSFWDLVDIINPLQHIPIVNNVYRAMTGDKINNFSRIAGGALFGGFIGAAIGGVNAIAVNETGDDLGGVAMAKLGLKDPMKKPEIENVAVKKDIPVIEVRPGDKKIGERLAHIPDHLRDVRVTAHEKITWDEVPVKTAAESSVAKPFDRMMDKPVEEAAAPAAPLPAAMPTPKELNALEPGNESSPLPQQVEAPQVPASMMKALAKYEAMQRMGATANPEDTNKILPRRKFAALDNTVRRY